MWFSMYAYITSKNFIQTFSMAFIDCIAVDKSILAIDKMLRSNASSLLLTVEGDTADDFETNNLGGEMGIILKETTWKVEDT